MDMDMLNWFLEHSKEIDMFFLIFGVIIEVVLVTAIWIIYKNFKKRSKKEDK